MPVPSLEYREDSVTFDYAPAGQEGDHVKVNYTVSEADAAAGWIKTHAWEVMPKDAQGNPVVVVDDRVGLQGWNFYSHNVSAEAVQLIQYVMLVRVARP